MKICAFIGDMYRDYSAEIIKSLQKYARSNGHLIDIFGNCTVPNENPLHAEGLKSILKIPDLNSYAGIILCTDTLHHAGLDNELLDTLVSSNNLPPIVSIRCDEEGFYNIVPNNRQIMHDVAQHAIAACGCDDIGFVMGRDDLVDTWERRAGFEDAMHEAGYEVREDRIFHGNYWTDQGPQTADFFTREDGSIPKAIICSNDYMALALMDELADRGFKIPQDTLITGIDNLDPSFTHIPSLTTSEIPEDVLVCAAVETLEKINAGENVDFYITVPGRLIVRESSGGTTERDIAEAYQHLDFIQKMYNDITISFVQLSSAFEDVMTTEDCVTMELNYIKDLKLFDQCYLCSFDENSRNIMGYFDKDFIGVSDIEYSQEDLLPEQFDSKKDGIRIFLPIYFKNEVYGYAVLIFNPTVKDFFDEKLEYALLIFAQTLNRLNLYKKLVEANDILDLYIRDALTGLYNRRGFEKKISALFKDGTSDQYRIAVASIDMDGLKMINDNYGHAAGDNAIKCIAECIEKSLNESEFVARMGGDEFEAVLILDNPGRIGQFIRTIRGNIKEANQHIDDGYGLSASIGTCEVADWNSLMEAMNKADKIMYVEKKTKKAGR